MLGAKYFLQALIMCVFWIVLVTTLNKLDPTEIPKWLDIGVQFTITGYCFLSYHIAKAKR